MKTIDFRKLEVQISFSGEKNVFDVAESLANMMMYNGSVLLDIGFEDLAKQIYYSEGGVEIPERYEQAIMAVVKASGFAAAIKREIINLLNN